jgi:hypothetical protein
MADADLHEARGSCAHLPCQEQACPDNETGGMFDPGVVARRITEQKGNVTRPGVHLGD